MADRESMGISLGRRFAFPSPGDAHWWGTLILAAGASAIAVPTMFAVGSTSWSTEQGAHGPLVLATGLWLIVHAWKKVVPLLARGSLVICLAILLPLLLVFVAARITGIVEVSSYAMYGSLVTIFYGLCGGRALRKLWFPFLYLAFIFPPPDTLVAAVTQPLKIWISSAAVGLLHSVGYPVANSGVAIQIAQYELMVAAACAGLNSMISLTAIGLFYVYIRHNANWRYALLLVLAIIPVAVAANLVRVLLLILITYHLGEAAAQGFLHGFAGLSMFTLALLFILAIDFAARPLRHRLGRQG